MEKNYNEISTKNIELTQEKNLIEKIINDYNNINDLIKNKEILINNIKKENIELNENNIIINQENNDIFEHSLNYRNHLIFLVNQNKYLSSEIQAIIGRDEEIKNVLQRTNYLKNILKENINLFNNSSNGNIIEKNNKSINFNTSVNSKNKIKNKNLSEKLENKYRTKINIFMDKKEKDKNDINKSINIANEKEKENRLYNANITEKEPNFEENNISNDLNNDEK